MKMMNKINKIQLIIVLFILVLIFSGAFVFMNRSDFVLPFYNVSKVDNMILGNVEKQDFLDMEINVIDKKQSSKRYDLIISKTKNLFLGLIKDEKENYLINNQGKFDSNFDLKRKTTGNLHLQIDYDNSQERLDFIMPEHNILINDNKINVKDTTIHSLHEIASDRIVGVEDNFFEVSDYQKTEIAINNIKYAKTKIFKSIGNNLLDTTVASFESELWKTEVGDCRDELDGDPDIALKESSDASDGKKSLELSSKNHYACTNKTFPIQMKKDKLYQLSFDYKNLSGRDVRYYYKLRSEKNNKILGYVASETIQAEDNEWHTFSTIINPQTVLEDFVHPEYYEKEKDGFNTDSSLDEIISDFYSGDPIKNIKYIEIFFYAPSDGSKEIINLYDNVQLKEYELAETREIGPKSIIDTDIVLVEDISLQQGENIFEYLVDNKNLLDVEIASFESGLWQTKAEDCDSSKPGESEIDLEESSDASDGKISAKLSSKNHFACISKAFPVNLSNGKLYKLQFDYKNMKGGKAKYYYSLRSNEKCNTNSEIIKVDDNEWHTHETIITPRINGIKNIDIFFYAPSDGSEEIVNLYDNVRLTEYLPKDIDSYYLHVKQDINETPKLDSVEYKEVNRWKSQVVLHGVKDSLLLAYPQKYSEKWKVYPVESFEGAECVIGKLPRKYSVSEIESNRQATKGEIEEFISSNLISVVGNKFISKNFDRSIRNDNLDNGWFGETLRKEAISEDTHYQINNCENSWWIDVVQLCESESQEFAQSDDLKSVKSGCIKNDDGTYDIALVIENKFNRWFCFGLLILAITFVSLFGCFCYDFIKKKNLQS